MVFKKYYFLIFVLFLMLGVSSFFFKQAFLQEGKINLKSFYHNTYHYQLANGMEVILKKTAKAPLTAIHLRVKTGSIHEEDYYGSGLSHFFEHSLFLGSEKHPKKDSFSEKIESYGGANVNAYTTYDHTAYYFTILSKYTTEGLKAIEDLVFHPLFPPQEVKNEIGSVLSEMDMRNDQADYYFNEFVSRFLFKNLPYKYPVIGFRERFSRLSPKELLDYYYKRYKPNNMILSVVGDVDLPKTLEVIEKIFLPNEKGLINEIAFEAEEEWSFERAETSHAKANFVRFSLMWQTVSYKDKQMYPLDVLAYLLGSGKGSLLYEKLKDELKLVEDISAFSWTPKENGIFDISFSLPILKNRSDIKERIDRIQLVVERMLENLSVKAIEKHRLESVKRKILLNFIHSRETAMGMAMGLAGSVMMEGGKLNQDEIYLSKINGVKKKDIIRVAKEFLKPHKMKVAILMPEKFSKSTPLYANSILDSANLGRFPIKVNHLKKEQKFSKSKWTNTQKLKEVLKKNTVKTNHQKTLITSKKVLKNGIKLLYCQDQELPKVELIIAALGGLSFEEKPILNGSFNLLTKLFMTSNSKYSRKELIYKLKQHGISLQPFSGKNSFGLKLSFLKDKTSIASKLLKAILLEENYFEEDFIREKEEVLFDLESQKENGWMVSRNQFRETFFKGTVYEKNSEGTQKIVEKIKLEDLKNLKKQFLYSKNMIVSIYGDIHFKEVKKYFTWLEALKISSAVNEKKIVLQDISYEETKSPIISKQKGFRQSFYRMGFRAPVIGDEDSIKLKVLEGYLSGMGGPLFKLRSAPFKNKSGGRAYQLGVFYDENKDYGALIFLCSSAL